MRFEALTAVLALRTVQWDVTLCSSVVWHQNFGGTSSSKMLLPVYYQITWCHVPKDCNLL